jgi:hypothetical protein
MLTIAKTAHSTVYACDICKEEYTNHRAASTCENSHGSCLHKVWAYSAVTVEGEHIVQRTCLNCQHSQTRTLPIGMDLWPLLKDY